jgi:hypothetical protein
MLMSSQRLLQADEDGVNVPRYCVYELNTDDGDM